MGEQMRQRESVRVKAARVAFLSFGMVLSGAVVAAWWLHKRFCQSCGDRAWAGQQAATAQAPDGEPSLFWSQHERRDGR